MLNSLFNYIITKKCMETCVSESVKYYYDYECNEPLVASSKLTATSSLRERGPENAKLYGK